LKQHYLTNNDTHSSHPELYLDTIFPKKTISLNNLNNDYNNLKLINKSVLNTINHSESADKTDYYNTNATYDNNIGINNNQKSNSFGSELFLPYLQNYNVGVIRGSEHNRESLNKISRSNNNISINKYRENQ
jgi:hypothetical protein